MSWVFQPTEISTAIWCYYYKSLKRIAAHDFCNWLNSGGESMNKIIMGVAAVLVLMIGAMVFVWSNLDGIVKDSIQTYGSQAVQTKVSVADVKLELEAGKASISGLTVANPAGFSGSNIFELGNIITKIDISSIRQNPIIIDEIIISAPVVVYEINKSGLSNVDVLKKQLGIRAGKSMAKASNDAGDELKMIIRKLVVKGSKAKVRIAALGNAEQTVNLPRIVLTDVGKKSGGATAAEVAQILSSKLLGNVKGSVASLGVNKFLGKSADAFTKRAKGAEGAVGNVGGAIGSGASGAAGAAGDAVKGLFGK